MITNVKSDILTFTQFRQGFKKKGDRIAYLPSDHSTFYVLTGDLLVWLIDFFVCFVLYLSPWLNIVEWNEQNQN